MYVERTHKTQGEKTYEQILLRESYRARKGKVDKRTLLNLTRFPREGEPVSVAVFSGNTQDPKTLGSQVPKTAERFGCRKVTFVGDRGMLKQAQKDELTEAGFYYITALTKPQIERLLKGGALQMELFDAPVCEVELDGRRLVLRRTPVRADELGATRSRPYARCT